MGLDGFAVLTKKQEDLLAKSYCLHTFALLTLTTASGPFRFKARASKRPDSSVVAKSSIEYKKGAFTFTPKRKSDGSGMYVLEYAVNPDLKVKSDCRANPSGNEGTISAEYSQPNYKAKVALVMPNPAVKLSATAGNNTHGFAVDGKLDLAAGRLVAYNFANYWLSPTHRLILKHTGSNASLVTLGDFTASFHQTISEKTAIAAVAKYSVPKKSTYIEFGGAHTISADLEVRGKVDSLGMLAASASKAWDRVKVTVATQVDMKKVVQTQVSDYKFGVRVDFTS